MLYCGETYGNGRDLPESCGTFRPRFFLALEESHGRAGMSTSGYIERSGKESFSQLRSLLRLTEKRAERTVPPRDYLGSGMVLKLKRHRERQGVPQRSTVGTE